MHNRTLFFAQAVILLCVGAVHVSALQWYLYWYYPWLDLLTHFLGGLWVALAAAWFFAWFGRALRLREIVGIVMCIGAGWEIFELLIHVVSFTEPNYPLDTSLDLLMDFCGGLFGFLIASRIKAHDIINPQ